MKTHVLFNAAKLLQTDLNAHLGCEHPRCGEKKRCLGGPRGTCRRTGGWPACTEEGVARLKETGHHPRWKRMEQYDMETPQERRRRRLETDLNIAKLQIMIANALSK